MKHLFVCVLASCLLCGLPVASSQQASPADAGMNPAAKAASASELETWRSTTTAAPPAKAGCYRLDYPGKTWQKIDCGPSPTDPPRTLRPMPVRKGVRPNVSLLSGDYTMTPANKITSATGRVLALNQVTSVGSLNATNNKVTANLFSLQINSNNTLAANTGSPSCKTSTNKANCTGWIQFVYNNSRQIFIQYWFINYLSSTTQSCPASLPMSSKGNPKSTGLDCGKNAAIATLASTAPSDFTKMQGASLTGQALSNGNVAATLTSGGTSYTVTGVDGVGAYSGWTAAEFNIFGSGTNSSGVFNQVLLNTAAQVTLGLTSDNDRSLTRPGCATGTTTAENSNMFLGPCYTTTAPGIRFDESPNTPKLTGLNPAQGPEAGGITVEVLGGPFTQPFQIDFGTQPVQPTNTLPNDVSVRSLADPGGVSVPVTAAYVFPNGDLGPFGNALQFSYFATPGCTFSESCPFYQNQPPSYTMTCSTSSDFYTTSDIHTPADFNLIAHGTTTNTGSTTGETVSLAACELGSKTQCNFQSIYVSSGQWCHSKTPPTQPPPCTKCGGGQKCCPNPDGGDGTVCVAATKSCPVIH